MAKVKLKTNTKIKTVRNLDGAAPATNRSTRRTTRKNIEVDEAPPAEKGSGGIMAIILMLVLIGGGGAGGYYYLKMSQKVPMEYIVTKEETNLLKNIDKRIENIQVDQTNLEFLLSDIGKFQDVYTIAQVVEVGEEKHEFLSPNIDMIQEIKDDTVEGLASSARERLRKLDHMEILKAQEAYVLEKQQEALIAKQKEDEAARIKAAEQAKVEAHKQLVAEGEKLDETKGEVRWNLLDVDMFDRSLFKPLEGKFSYDFLTSEKRVDPWVKFELDAQKNWGHAMVEIIKSARYTFGILSNSGTDYRGWEFFYEKRKGNLMNISKLNFRIRVIDNVEGIEVARSLERPIIDIPPDEFFKLLERAVKPENLQNSVNASKNWAALKAVHPGKSESQILKFGFASIMYMLKQFPASKAMIKEVSEISTDVLKEEIDFVEPTFNRREMKTALEIASGLYGDGKRQDALMILEKMKTRFDFTNEWSEFENDFNRLKNDAMKIKKR